MQYLSIIEYRLQFVYMRSGKDGLLNGLYKSLKTFQKNRRLFFFLRFVKYGEIKSLSSLANYYFKLV